MSNRKRTKRCFDFDKASSRLELLNDSCKFCGRKLKGLVPNCRDK